MLRKLFYLSLCSWIVIQFSSCKKDDSGGACAADTGNDSLHITVSKDTVELNGFDFIKITVRDGNGTDVTDKCTLRLNDNTLISSTFIPISIGNYSINASKCNHPSQSVPIFVTARSTSPFTTKALVEDLTGTWCGYCPRVAYALETYKATHPNLITVGVHSGGDDPMKYQYYSSLASAFAVSGYPAAILNRTGEWDENTSRLTQALRNWAPLGLGITSTESGGTITGTVKVKYNVTTDRPMKLVIALVENELVADQTNYYSAHYGATPYLYVSQTNAAGHIPDFVHNGVLRKTSTNLFGDAIPAGVQVKNGEYTVPFTMTLTGLTAAGTTYNAVAANCAIVAFVTDASTANAGVFNAQYAAVGSSQDYD